MRVKRTVKRIFMVICAMAILLMSVSFLDLKGQEALASTYVWDTETKVKLGDAKQDQIVDVKDLVRIKRHIADETVEVSEHASDINFDGNVNGDDVALLQKQLVGCDQYWSDVY